MTILERAFRVYSAPEDFERTIAFYEQIQHTRCERRVEIRETRVSAAKVGGFLILAGNEEQLARVRHVQAIFYVDALDDFVFWLDQNGAERLHGPGVVTGGRNATVRHADGIVVEYFEPAAPEQKSDAPV
jgi:predicted enzyme related to lactoylglutathione lyase